METLRKKLKTYRRGDPFTCQRIWDALKQLKNDRKSTSADHILKYCCRSFLIDKDTLTQQLEFLVEDKLLVQRVLVKGQGVEVAVYHIPTEEEADLSGTNDWYCFQCHKPGKVLSCESCPRVFHLECLPEDFEEEEDKFLCPICKKLSLHQSIDDFDRIEVNLLLSFACNRLQTKLPAIEYIWNQSLSSMAHNASFTTDRCAALLKKIPKQSGPDEDAWRGKFLLRCPFDISKMDDRTDRQVYKSLEQFQADCAGIVHNIVVFYGEHSPVADSARVMQRDCAHELNEINICADCYKRSNAQEEKDWFCQPCDPPHELVYAKAKGYPFWPAKVLKIRDDIYDVRFFGAKHDRAKIHETSIRPITFDINSVVTKRSSAWTKAIEEMRMHQDLLSQIDSANSSEESGDDMETQKLPTVPEKIGSPQCREVRISLARIDQAAINRTNSSNKSGETSLEPVRAPSPLNVMECLDNPSLMCMANEQLPNSSEILEAVNNNGKFSEIEKLRKEYDEEIITLNKLHQNQIEFIQKLHTTELQRMKDALDESAKQSEAVELQIASIQKCHMTEIQKVKDEIEFIKQSHAIEIQKLKDEHDLQIAANKKKLWCTNCEKEGILHCCSSVQYCSITCQRENWGVHRLRCARKNRREAQSN